MPVEGPVLVLMAALAAAILLGLGLLLFRRAGVRSSSLFLRPVPCCYRPSTETASWRRAELRLSHEQLSLRGRGGLAVGPWPRGGLQLGIARPGEAEVVRCFRSDHRLVVVPCQHQGREFELALTQDHYTALRSWLEAVPPGWNVNVA